LSGRYRSEADFTQDARLVRMASRWGGFDPTAEINRRKLGLVQAVTKLAEDAGLRLSHLATAFTVTHPDVTSAIIGPRTMEQHQDTLAGVDVRLDNDLLDALDALLPPGTDINQHDPSSDPAELAATYRRGA
jgi:aryl-alcohol dehydrogenase-like predicted oxidoreductase